MRTYQGPWMDLASCLSRQDLPWILDRDQVRPSQALDMKVVCASCMVCFECQDFVDCEEITGGFWAGEHREVYDDSLDGAA